MPHTKMLIYLPHKFFIIWWVVMDHMFQIYNKSFIHAIVLF
jgi:hypothetical protein